MEIPFRKDQLFFQTLGSFFLIALGIFGFNNLVSGEEIIIKGTVYTLSETTSFILRFILVFGVLFFGFLAYFPLKNLFLKKPGLILDNTGIYFNHPSWRGKIPWKKIKDFRYKKIGKNFSRKIFLTLKDDPPKKFFRPILGYEMKPFIEVNYLRADPEKLVKELKNFLNEY